MDFSCERTLKVYNADDETGDRRNNIGCLVAVSVLISVVMLLTRHTANSTILCVFNVPPFAHIVALIN